MGQTESVLVCYSGGLDSALGSFVAHEKLGAKAIGMTAVSPSLAPSELSEACALAAKIGARHELVESSEIEDPNYVKNGADRCFYCKSELYRISTAKRDEWGSQWVLTERIWTIATTDQDLKLPRGRRTKSASGGRTCKE